ncbi:MAG: prepilin peptidase [Acidimicrobiia bacterium]|nr:prepilin peptidase [Acidimicrobiia bacterium]
MEGVLSVVAGLLIGSFLNVCVYRLPRDMSVTWPGSRCTTCGHAIAWYENVPVVSYLLMRARCRHCRAGIAWRYPAVEAVTAALFLLGYLTWGPSAGAVKFAVFAALLVGMIVSDLETRILPDEFTKGGMAAGFVASFLVPIPDSVMAVFLPGVDRRVSSLVEAGVAAGLASGALWGVGVVYSKLREKEGLGFGDVKMVAMMGAFLGLPATLAAVMFGCIAGSVLGLGYIWATKKDAATYELPFGSFLGAAAIVVGLTSEGMLHWYRGM